MNIFPTLKDATTLLHHQHRLHLFNEPTTSYTKPQNNLGSDTTPAHMFIVSRLAFPRSRIVCTINCCSFSSHVCLSHLISLPSHCTIQAVSSSSFAHTPLVIHGTFGLRTEITSSPHLTPYIHPRASTQSYMFHLTHPPPSARRRCVSSID